MAILRSQFYRGSVALLVWAQEIEKCMTTRYDIHLPEMNYLASSLSSKECYDFYNLLSHRRSVRGRVSIYAEKEKAQEISCISLLTTWLTDPAEASSRSKENIELKLREIGRRDLARWVLGQIKSSLERRQLSIRETNRQIEESEMNSGIGLKRAGKGIIPITFVDDENFLKNDNMPQHAVQTSCVFWKAFFICLVILLLAILFLCFYRFVYTKLRCICRRFDNADDKESFLREQTYGTTSCSSLPKSNSGNRRCHDLYFKDINEAKMNGTIEKLEMSENVSPMAGKNEAIFPKSLQEKKALLLNSPNESRQHYAKEARKSSSISNIKDPLELPMLLSKPSRKSQNSSSPLPGNAQRTTKSVLILKNDSRDRSRFSNHQKNIVNPLLVRKSKSSRRNMKSAGKIERSRSESIFKRAKGEKTFEKETFSTNEETGLVKSEGSEWILCSCNLINKSPRTILPTKTDEKGDEASEMAKNLDKSSVPSRASLAELSETYDELGMFFSHHLKQQSVQCRRKYCAVTRKLRRNKIFYHDVKKCRNRRKTNFGEKIIIGWDRRPACSTGNICEDTYDEYKIMRATREEREKLARLIVERRKCFLHQPCWSPDRDKK